MSPPQTFQESWKGLSFTVDRVCLISRAGFLDPYIIRHTVGLGQGLSSAVREVNVPYIATVGPYSSSTTDGLVSLYNSTCCHQVSFLQFGWESGSWENHDNKVFVLCMPSLAGRASLMSCACHQWV